LEKGAGGGDVREGGFDDFVVRLMQTRHACDHKHGEEMEESLKFERLQGRGSAGERGSRDPGGLGRRSGDSRREPDRAR
jgi:hypothetical protein